MDKKLKRTLLSFAVAATMCAGAFGFAACDNTPETNDPVDPTPPGITEEVDDSDFRFKGSATVGGKTYNVSIGCYEDDNTVVVNTGVAGAAKINGIYFYDEHKGYSFILSDNAGTALTSKYNTTKKQHEVVYHLTLGDDGEADVTLTLADDKFVPTSDEATFLSGSFKGEVSIQMPVGQELKKFTADLELKLDVDGTCEITTSNDTAGGVFAGYCNTSGEYEFKNNKFTFEIDDKEFNAEKDPATTTISNCVYNPVTGGYTADYELHANGNTITSTLTYTPVKTLPQQAASLSGETTDGTKIVAFFLTTGEVRIDQVGATGSIVPETLTVTDDETGEKTTIPNPDYNADLDNTGKCYFLNGQYIFVMEHGVFTSTYEDGEYTMEYTFASGDKVTLTGEALTGLVLEDTKPVGSFGDIKAVLYFTDDTNCVIDVSAKLASFAAMLDKKATYVVNDDGSITLTVVTNSYVSDGNGGYTVNTTTDNYDITFNGTTNTFTMETYTISGQDGKADMVLTGALWAD